MKNLGENVLQQREKNGKWKQEIEKQDYYGEIGCCKVCDETQKENMEGIQRDVWFNGRYYSCVCLEEKCGKCSWYYKRKCRKTEVMLL